MKCDRRWFNDGRVSLEGEERSVRYWGWTPGEPFWLWWIASDDAERYRQAHAVNLSILRIVLPEDSVRRCE